MYLKIIAIVVASALVASCGKQVPHSESTQMVQQRRPAPSAAPMAEMAEAAAVAADIVVEPVQDTERYGEIKDNPVKEVSREPISTFSADVDTGSYANVRRFLNDGSLPPKDAVRVEELINYFPLETTLQARQPHPFALETEVVDSPWLADAKVLRIVMQAKEQQHEAMPPANLVFLVDVSGSMDDSNKLGLAKKTLRLLSQQLRAQDKVTLITYASGTEVHISGASGRNTGELMRAINQLQASGSTAGADAMELAYQEAQKHFIKGGINRILMMTDGDFNVGMVDFNTLKGRVEQQRKSGVSLTTLGFGTGNYNEHLMEQMADAGDGNYAYIDNEKEAKKVLQQQLTSTLSTVASDVKIQVEFNPVTVSQYRLIGYENRQLQQEDFNNDHKDAGDIGAGHTVTALYEFVPQGKPGWLNASRYQATAKPAGNTDEYAHVNVRYKPVGKSQSVLLSRPVAVSSKSLHQASGDTRFSIAVATYGQLLRGGDMVGKQNWHNVVQMAQEAKGRDEFGLREEFVQLVKVAQSLDVKK